MDVQAYAEAFLETVNQRLSEARIAFSKNQTNALSVEIFNLELEKFRLSRLAEFGL
jgi:hypothetical protein